MEAQEQIVVLDFGSQYSQLIARRVRECHVYSQVLPYTTTPDALRALAPKGIILSGGPCSVYEAGAPQIDPAILDLGVPVLGICYGMQLMAQTLGGRVGPGTAREYGRAEVRVTDPASPLFEGIPERSVMWMSHGDKVLSTPAGMRTLAVTDNTEYAAVAFRDGLFGIQFHPEVVHSDHGARLLRNFCHAICRCHGDWSMASFIETQTAAIRERVGDAHVILGLSGGVDSSVAAALIHRAIGKQLTCIFVDNGLLRKNEAARVRQLFAGVFDMDLRFVDASETFLAKLAGVDEPEAKRKIIGHTFIDVFADAARAIPNVTFLAQGTTYPDVIESVPINGNPAAMIKSPVASPRTWPSPSSNPSPASSRTRCARSAASSACPRTSSCASPSPAPASASAASAPSTARSSTSSARPTTSSSKRSRPPATTTNSGRPSPSSCPSAPSASWATSAPTITSSPCASSPPPTA